jgi:hypothetical protein
MMNQNGKDVDRWTAGFLCGVAILTGSLGFASVEISQFAGCFYHHSLPGSALPWITRVASRIPAVWLMLTVFAGLIAVLAAFGKIRWKWQLGLVFAVLVAAMMALSIMAWGFLRPLRNVTWGVGP